MHGRGADMRCGADVRADELDEHASGDARALKRRGPQDGIGW